MKAKANKQLKDQANARRRGMERAAETGAQSGSQQQAPQQGGRQGERTDNRSENLSAGRMGAPQEAEPQQSAQREGMGSHRHPRPNEEALDATADVDSLGTHERGAAISREDTEGT